MSSRNQCLSSSSYWVPFFSSIFFFHFFFLSLFDGCLDACTLLTPYLDIPAVIAWASRNCRYLVPNGQSWWLNIAGLGRGMYKTPPKPPAEALPVSKTRFGRPRPSALRYIQNSHRCLPRRLSAIFKMSRVYTIPYPSTQELRPTGVYNIRSPDISCFYLFRFLQALDDT